MTYRNVIAVCLLAAAGCQVRGSSIESTPTAHYLANAGVLITNGETKVVFDPLFRNDFGSYQLLPEAIERALFAGDPPFDGLDAVLISHYHEDHFSAVDILRLMDAQPALQLYAPAQAVSGMKAIATDHHRAVFARVSEISLEYKEDPVTIEAGDLIVDAVRIPHSGWPSARTDVENIAFRSRSTERRPSSTWVTPIPATSTTPTTTRIGRRAPPTSRSRPIGILAPTRAATSSRTGCARRIPWGCTCR